MWRKPVGAPHLSPVWGTSPHTRRKLEQISNQLDLAGNISAYAEKTWGFKIAISDRGNISTHVEKTLPNQQQ